MAFTVHVKNGPVFSSDVPVTGKAVLSESRPEGGDTVVAWRVNNYLRSLDWVIEDSAEVEFIDTSSFEGMEVYRRSLSFLLVLACRKALGRNIVLRHSISEGYYWEDQEGPLSGDDLQAIKTMMADLISKDLPFVRKVVSLDKARKIFERQGSCEVARLFKWAGVDPVELYRCADIYGYYYAPLAPSTGYLKLFDLKPLGPGMVLQFPTINYPSALPPFRASKNLSSVFLDYARWLEVLDLRNMDSLHKKVAEGKALEVILISEAFHARNLGRIAEEISSRPKVKVVAIAGPSGSGKTTIMKLITGEIHPSSGRITVNDFDMSRVKRRKLPKMRRTLGVIFQDYRLIENMSVYDNVAFAMRVVGASGKEISKRVPYVLELVGLEGREKRLPNELSGGEQQRVAIARALVNSPRMIVADEPTGNLDPVRSLELMLLFEKINEMGTTILVVTHEKELVNAFSKRVVTIDGGHVISDGMDGYYSYEIE